MSTLTDKISSTLQLSDLFTVRPPITWPLEQFYIALAVICAVGGIFIIFYKKVSPTARVTLSTYFWTNFFIVPFIWFFRDQRIPYIGVNIFYFLHIIGALGWLVYIVFHLRKALPQEKLQESVKSYREKYLPKPKKNR